MLCRHLGDVGCPESRIRDYDGCALESRDVESLARVQEKQGVLCDFGGEGRKGCVLLRRRGEYKVAVDFVGEDEHIVFQADLGEPEELGFGVHAAERVVGAAEEENLSRELSVNSRTLKVKSGDAP